MTRQAIKNAVKTQISGAANLKAVYLFRPKEENVFPRVVISVLSSDETRTSASAPHGKKKLEATVQLEILHVDNSPDGSEQLTFDDLLDQIDAQLRLDPMFGGAATLGATIKYIRTTVAQPHKANGQSVILAAVKHFDFSIEFTG